MSAIPRPHRHAVSGEIVNFFEGGDPTEIPYVGTVHQVHPGGSCTITFQRPGHPSVQTKYGVKHIHDEYWDSVPLTTKQATGAFDFHPVYRGVFDRSLQAIAGNKARMEKLEQDKSDMSDDEFNALSALERFGDNIGKISDETGISRDRLNRLTRFKEELKAVKQRNWEEKNGVSSTVTLEPAAE